MNQRRYPGADLAAESLSGGIDRHSAPGGRSSSLRTYSFVIIAFVTIKGTENGNKSPLETLLRHYLRMLLWNKQE
ncbi:hypothetical protein [Dankookia sp. P2]|uniref:hypothetical protein n=1 Tax=Dankookia sp. P2 TaxID=3423955 RepID=UPI003D67B2D2